MVSLDPAFARRDKSETRIVVVMQRVHQNDLVGYLQEHGGFEVLNLRPSQHGRRPSLAAVAPMPGCKMSFSTLRTNPLTP